MDNDSDRNDANKDKKVHTDTIVGFKPLMYFCFDHTVIDYERHPQTVAITCPKYALST
jgi:hypothetical protein